MAIFKTEKIDTSKIASDRCEKLLYAIVLTLVFEGILRKYIPALKMPLFFLKDIFCFIGLLIINNIRLSKDMDRFKSKCFALFVFLLPLLFFTATKDLLLGVFAAKQYLLYFVATVLLIVAFPSDKQENFRRFLFFCSLLLIPTIIVANIQNVLPATHWLNRSVGGENLVAFSSGGRLRVSSTFSFTGQYSWFINAEAFFLTASYFLQPNFNDRVIKKLMPFVHFALILILIASAFITGGRTAVLGCASTFLLGAIFIGTKRPAWFIARGLPILLIAIVGLFALRQIKPEYFTAYDNRSKGTQKVSHNEEVEGRILAGFTDWTSWFWIQDNYAVFFGNGLGIMSNGSAQISKYAARIRDTTYWTEGDVPTTFWEGGLYLAVIWYGFRLSMILLCYRLWRSIKDYQLSAAAAMPLGFVIVQGINGTLAIQPPVALWWWLAIGVIFFIYTFDKHRIATVGLSTQRIYKEKDYIH